MVNISRRQALVVAGLSILHPKFARSQALASSCIGLNSLNCATKITALINSAATAEEAVQLWGEWAEVYEKAYRGMKDSPVTPDDLDRFEGAISDKIDSLTNPADIATDLAIKRYFPRLAGVLEFAEGPVVFAVMAFLAPSPLETPLQELQSLNHDVSDALILKLAPELRSGWRSDFSNYVSAALEAGTLKKP